MTSPPPALDVVRIRTGRPVRPAGARRPPDPRRPSHPARSPSSSSTRVPSWMTTPRSRATRRRPRARIAGWIVAATGMNAPAAEDRRRDARLDRGRIERHVAVAVAGRGTGVDRVAPLVVLGRGRADRDRAALRVPGVHAVRRRPAADLVDRVVDGLRGGHGPGDPVPLDQRRQLVPPAGGEPAVAPGRPTTADVGLEEDDPRARRLLGDPDRRPQPGVPATDDGHVRRRRAAQRRRGVE